MTNSPPLPRFEFHISRQARERYHFDEALFATSGNVIFANFHAARLFAQQMNKQRDLASYPERAVRAGQINAMGLIDEIMHMVVAQYRQDLKPTVMGDALDWLDGMLGREAVDASLGAFVEQYPPLAVYRQGSDPAAYLAGETDGTPNRQVALEELVMLWLANANPAFSPYQELFDDSRLTKETSYPKLISLVHAFFETQPPYGPDSQNLIDMLRSPAIAMPHSLTGQLEYIRQRWGSVLGKLLFRLLSSLDLIKEEEKVVFGGPGPARVIEYGGLAAEPERFSPDKDWMPSLVLIAKNAFVWLDQLSKKYHAPINRLDQIPDEELDRLARWGFTGLWLIGLWERSAASQRVKQLRGNPEAVASAYSLFDYQIANDLGGDASYDNLRQRAWQRGIRLASDMVPNHTGIDSRWVIEHPDWFIASDHSPFPSYTFNGPNLSWDQRVGIYIEDHYYDNTDAAVVFKRVDYWTGQEKYIYHGNDGTSMPWNDTAQLDYLKPEVREAVIQTILHVARKFPVIRFDAAMTLAKKHFQRLWFPEPGTGGAIPSRAEAGLTKSQFDERIPVEFWREVVDRVAQEVPDTLLLAEAFWLMEGYFVRTLGMHRVYNSAFMNMLRDEKNAEYRQLIKNTLEFEPEILKRYVSFMNNPDERTAVDQFGKGDKYFGICTLMSTLPGLPMYGHGQIEGFTEKYGMEYRRAYWEEQPDGGLIERHEHEIFPLLRKRYLFAGVSDFLLYDFFTSDGHVNEDVFAYSNRIGDERGLVIYHNKYASTQGWVRVSAAYLAKSASGDKSLVQKTLADSLGLENNSQVYTIYRDVVSGLEYIRNNQELHQKGFYAELEAYKRLVLIDFRQVQENEWGQYAQLASYLNGRGVPSIEEAVKELFLQPIHHAFRELVNPGFFRWVITHRQVKPATREESEALSTQVLEEGEDKAAHLLSEIRRITNSQVDILPIAGEMKWELGAILQLPVFQDVFPLPGSRKYAAALKFLHQGKAAVSGWTEGDAHAWGTLLGWLSVHSLGRATGSHQPEEVSRSWVDEWLLNKIIAGSLAELGLSNERAWKSVRLIKLLTTYSGWWEAPKKDAAYQVLYSLFSDPEAQAFLGVNRYKDVLWFNKEALDELLWWLFVVALVDASHRPITIVEVTAAIVSAHAQILKLKKAAEASGFQVEKLLTMARQD